MDRIFIKDLVVHAIIGVNDWERKVPQEIVINLALFMDLREAGDSDDIRDSVDYSRVAENVRKLVETSHRFTVEALASDLASLCLSEPGVRKVQVRVDKPGAIKDSSSAGVEIERIRRDNLKVSEEG